MQHHLGDLGVLRIYVGCWPWPWSWTFCTRTHPCCVNTPQLSNFINSQRDLLLPSGPIYFSSTRLSSIIVGICTCVFTDVCESNVRQNIVCEVTWLWKLFESRSKSLCRHFNTHILPGYG